MIWPRTRATASILEARLVDREAQQLEAVVERARQGLEMAREMVPVGPETEMDRQILDSAVEGARVVRPRALVEDAGEQRGEPLLALGILRGSAAGRKLQGDQGNGVALDEPSLDAAGALHALHGIGARALVAAVNHASSSRLAFLVFVRAKGSAHAATSLGRR